MNNVKALLAFLCIAAVSAGAAIQPLMIGQPIPETPLRTMNGEPFSLRAAAQEQQVVLIYYRGGWCPYCNVHLQQLQAIEPQLRRLGYRIIAVSADKPSRLQQSMAQNQLTYTLLSDASMQTADAFGIAYKVDQPTLQMLGSNGMDIEKASGRKHHMLPVPSVFLIGTDGIIDFVYANPDYRVRLKPDVLLAAAKASVESDAD